MWYWWCQLHTRARKCWWLFMMINETDCYLWSEGFWVVVTSSHETLISCLFHLQGLESGYQASCNPGQEPTYRHWQPGQLSLEFLTRLQSRPSKYTSRLLYPVWQILKQEKEFWTYLSLQTISHFLHMPKVSWRKPHGYFTGCNLYSVLSIVRGADYLVWVLPSVRNPAYWLSRVRIIRCVLSGVRIIPCTIIRCPDYPVFDYLVCRLSAQHLNC